MDLPVRVFCRNQKRAATETSITTTVMTWEVRMARPSSRPVDLLEVAGADDEAGAVLEALLVGADDEAGERVVDEHDADAGDDEDHRVAALLAVEAVDPAVGEEREDRRGDDADGERESAVGRGPRLTPRLCSHQVDEDDDHGAERHEVAVGEVGEAQDGVDEGDAEGAEGELRAVGDGRDEDEVGEEDEGVEEVLQAQPPRKVRRTSGSARSASPVSV